MELEAQTACTIPLLSMELKDRAILETQNDPHLGREGFYAEDWYGPAITSQSGDSVNYIPHTSFTSILT